MKQTAAEWLMQTLEQNNIIDLDSIDSDKYYTIIEQAKAMEQEQIESAYRKGYTESSWGRHSNSEQYYNETFKSE